MISVYGLITDRRFSEERWFQFQRGDSQDSNQHINSKNSNTDLEKESKTDEKERDREREDQYTEDTYGMLSGSKTP